MRSIRPEELEKNVFHMIGKEWLLVTAEKEGKVNTMTASWGGLGVMWGKNVAYIVLRPQRYTKEFVDREEYFTLSFFGEEYRKALALCGAKSGREVDKVKECGFTVEASPEGAPYFEQADLVLVCRKRFVQAMDPANMPEDAKEKWYPNKDYHVMYMAEIVRVLTK